MRRPPQLRRLVEPPGDADDGPQVGNLGPHRPAAVGVYGGHLLGIPAVLAEAAEARRVQDTGLHAEPAERAAPLHPVQNVLLLHACRLVPRLVPLVEQRRCPVARCHEEESGVELVAEVVVRPAVEPIGADQEVLLAGAVQALEGVPQPHHIQILASYHIHTMCEICIGHKNYVTTMCELNGSTVNMKL